MKELKIGQRHLAVCKLQAALNKDAKLRGLNRASGFPIKTDGHFGEKTKLALMQFQAARNLPQTGIADEATLKLLRLHEVRHTPAAKHVPSLCELKNPLQERLSQFLSSAENDYGVDVRITCTLRDAKRAQELHIAHMIKYNSFTNRKPNGERSNAQPPHVIAWSYLKRFDVAQRGWRNVEWQKFLTAKNGFPSVPNATWTDWLEGFEPEEAKTRETAFRILQKAGVNADKTSGLPHSGMVAPGYEKCGEPCCCGGGASKHLSGEAVDLDDNNLEQLGRLVSNQNLDEFLQGFELHRPLWKPGYRKESWHIEAQT